MVTKTAVSMCHRSIWRKIYKKIPHISEHFGMSPVKINEKILLLSKKNKKIIIWPNSWLTLVLVDSFTRPFYFQFRR